MTSGQAAAYGVGAVLLVACIAAANMPSEDRPPARAARPSPAGPAALASEVSAQAARLQMRMAQAPVPESSPRNPFTFGLPPRGRAAANGNAGMMRVPSASDPPPAVYVPPLPVLTLMGIAEETTANGPKRTAVIGGEGDAIYLVSEGQPVGTRYKVTKIGADAIELEDVVSKAYRRLALR